MRSVTNPRESTLLTRESSCKRSGAQAQSWLVSVLHGCMAHTYVAARSRASEVLSWHFIHTLLDAVLSIDSVEGAHALDGSRAVCVFSTDGRVRAPVLLSRICAQGRSAALRECSRSCTVIVRGLDRNARFYFAVPRARSRHVVGIS